MSLIDATGTSMREPGAHMAVAEDGLFVGSLSGGCIERAVVAEAVEAIAAGVPRVTRFGKGSPYIDIRLPCGGGVDLHFQPLLDADLVHQALSALAERRAFTLDLSITARPPRLSDGWHPSRWIPDQGRALVGHWPDPRVLIVGHGAAVAKLAALGRVWGADISVLTPDTALAAQLMHDGVAVQTLTSPQDKDPLVSDAWTAIVFLFHDHDWEPALIAHALAQPHFFLGAMGSRLAHAHRSAALRFLGVPEAAIAGVSAPIGLFHSVRDPATLAISVLAEVAERYRTKVAVATTAPDAVDIEI